MPRIAILREERDLERALLLVRLRKVLLLDILAHDCQSDRRAAIANDNDGRRMI